MKARLSRFILWYLRKLAQFSIKINKPFVIGIAGTAGKSSTRNALSAILSHSFVTKTVYGNSETGIPLGILGIKVLGYSKFDWLVMLIKAPFGVFYLSGAKYLIAEMGIDEPDPPKNMEYLLTILKPQISIYLNEGSVHTMQFEKKLGKKTFKSEKEKLDYLIQLLANEDVKIITKSGCRIGIYNNDDKFVVRSLQNYKQDNDLQELLTFGKDKNCDAFYKSYSVDLTGTKFIIRVHNQEFVLHFKDFILPQSYQENFAASILAAYKLGLSLEKIEASLIKYFKLPAGRSSLFEGINESVIIDSSYNSSKLSTLSFVSLLKLLKIKNPKRPIVFLFGDMREIGSGEIHEHREVTKNLGGIVDYVYCVGKVTQKTVLPLLKSDKSIKDVKWFQNSELLGQYLKNNLSKQSIVLVKGSQNTIFLEEAIKPILRNKGDIKKLCRNENYWMKIKRQYFDLQ